MLPDCVVFSRVGRNLIDDTIW